MICSQCQIVTNKLTEVFATSPSYETSFQSSSSSSTPRLCDNCLVGRTVPIYRPHVHEWHVGDIDEFDRKTGMHHFLFPDNEEEWLKVEANPFRSYLSHHKFLAAQFSQQSRSEPPQANGDYHALLDLPNIHVDERDDVNAFDTTAVMRHDPDEHLFPHDAPFRFGLSRQPPPYTMQPESRRVPDSIWVEQQGPRMMFFQPPPPPPPTTQLEPVVAHARHHWTWPSFGFGGAPRVHPQVVTPSTAHHNPVVMHYDPRVILGEDDYRIAMTTTHHSQIFVEATSTPKKTCPRFWTVEEDNLLLAAVESRGGHELVKSWPTVAKSLVGRTGKQCRERYMNHLKPRVKLHRWSAVEDSVAFRLFQSIGSKWSMISKWIPGRTDNGVKNRVHFLKRRLDQHVVHSSSSGVDETVLPFVEWENTKTEEQVELLRKSYLLLSRLNDSGGDQNTNNSSIVIQGDFQNTMSEYNFGPFRSLEEQASCLRCHLMMPSEQTGRSVCETTGWCIACTKLPPYLSGFVLAKFLSVRRSDSRNGDKGSAMLEEAGFV